MYPGCFWQAHMSLTSDQQDLEFTSMGDARGYAAYIPTISFIKQYLLFPLKKNQ